MDFRPQRPIDRQGLIEAALPRLGEIFRAVWGEPERPGASEWRPKPARKGMGADPRRMVMRGPKAGLWADAATGEGGSLIDFWALHIGRSPQTDFAEILRSLAAFVGYQGAALDPAEQERLEAGRRAARAKAEAEAEAEEARKAAETAGHLGMMRAAALPLSDPRSAPARAYLAARRLEAPPSADLAFIPAGSISPFTKGLKTPERPALVLWCRNEGGRIVAAQRIILKPDGSDRARDLDAGKPMTGRAAEHPLRLEARAEDETCGALILAEGFESALAVWTATGAETLACFDAGGLARAIERAPEGRRILIAADRDAPGNPARRRVDEACEALAARHPDAWRALAPEALIPTPPPNEDGKIRDGADAADVLRAHGPAGVLAMMRGAARLAPPSPAPPEPASDAPRAQNPARPGQGSGLPPHWPGGSSQNRAEILAAQNEAIFQTSEAGFLLAATNLKARAYRARLQEEIREEADALRAADPALSEQEASARARRPILKREGLARLPREEAGARDLFTGAAGSGKTRTATMAVARHGAGSVTAFLLPTTEKAREAYETYLSLRGPDSPPALIWMGRSTPPAQSALVGRGPMCRRAQAAAALAEKGGNVRKSMCSGCPLIAQCAYLAQEKEAQERIEDGRGLVVFATHASAFAGSAGFPKADLVVIDEFAHGAAYSERILRLEELTALELEDASAEEIELIEEARPMVEAMAAAFRAAPHGAAERLRRAGFDPAAAIKIGRKLEALDALREKISSFAEDAQIIEALKRAKPSSVPLAGAMLRRAGEMLATDRRTPTIHGLMIVTAGEAPALRLSSIRDLSPKIAPRTASIVALDATGDPDLWAAYLGTGLRRRHYPVERLMILKQVRGWSGSKTSIMGDPERRQDLIDIIGRISREQGGDVLCIAQKAVREALEPQTREAQWMHYGATRGMNSAEQCLVAIVTGRVQPSVDAIDAVAGAYAARLMKITGKPQSFTPATASRALMSPEEIRKTHGGWAKATRRRRMRDGSVSCEEVTVHPDPLGDAVLKQMREAELTQSVDRLRMIYADEPKVVYLLTSIPIDAEVDEITTLDELCGRSRLQRALAECLEQGSRVLPLSPAALSEAAPETFRTPKAAEHWLCSGDVAWLKAARAGDRSKLIPRFAYMNSYRETGVLISALLVAFRKQGSRGKPTLALVSAPRHEARRAVEAEMGALHHFEILSPEIAEKSAPKTKAPALPPPPLHPPEPAASPWAEEAPAPLEAWAAAPFEPADIFEEAWPSPWRPVQPVPWLSEAGSWGSA